MRDFENGKLGLFGQDASNEAHISKKKNRRKSNGSSVRKNLSDIENTRGKGRQKMKLYNAIVMPLMLEKRCHFRKAGTYVYFQF